MIIKFIAIMLLFLSVFIFAIVWAEKDDPEANAIAIGWFLFFTIFSISITLFNMS